MENKQLRVPPTNVMVWYGRQEVKSEVLRYLMAELGCSITYVQNIVRGYTAPKKEVLNVRLSEITGIPVEKLYEYAE